MFDYDWPQLKWIAKVWWQELFSFIICRINFAQPILNIFVQSKKIYSDDDDDVKGDAYQGKSRAGLMRMDGWR